MGSRWWARTPPSAPPLLPGAGDRRAVAAAAAAAPAAPATPSSWHQPAVAAVILSASKFLLLDVSALLSLSDITLFLHLHQETNRKSKCG